MRLVLLIYFLHNWIAIALSLYSPWHHFVPFFNNSKCEKSGFVLFSSFHCELLQGRWDSKPFTIMYRISGFTLLMLLYNYKWLTMGCILLELYVLNSWLLVNGTNNCLEWISEIFMWFFFTFQCFLTWVIKSSFTNIIRRMKIVIFNLILYYMYTYMNTYMYMYTYYY